MYGVVPWTNPYKKSTSNLFRYRMRATHVVNHDMAYQWTLQTINPKPKESILRMGPHIHYKLC
jgi:hypothetical protein